MISYEPLMEIMKKQNATTYTLREKGGIGSGTVSRILAGESVSTNTIDTLCKLFSCKVEDIMVYKDELDI
jgi:DNA-binding Xre family transcriptional regulator